MVQGVHVLILFVNYYYRMEADYDSVSSSYFLFPAALQVAAVGLVVVISTAMMTYELVKWAKHKLFKD